MADLKRRIVCCAALSVCLPCSAAPVQSQERPAVKSELRVGEQTVQIHFGAALEVDDVEGIRLQGTPKKVLRVLLADSELAPAVAGSWSRCSQLAREDKLHAVELSIDPAKKEPFGGAVYYHIPGNDGALLSLKFTAKNDGYEVKDLKISATEVSGVFQTLQPQDWPQLAEGAKPVQFEFTLPFRIPITHQPAVTGVITGPPALASAPVKAFLAYEAACRTGDIAGARALATVDATAEWDAILAKSPAEFKKMLQAAMPDTKTRSKQITRVVLRGDRATVIFKEDGGLGWQPLVKLGGKWLIDAS